MGPNLNGDPARQSGQPSRLVAPFRWDGEIVAMERMHAFDIKRRFKSETTGRMFMHRAAERTSKKDIAKPQADVQSGLFSFRLRLQPKLSIFGKLLSARLEMSSLLRRVSMIHK
jgi:hypothetical protein